MKLQKSKSCDICSTQSLHLILIWFSFNLLCKQTLTAAFVPSNETDQMALLKFKQGIDRDPHSVLSSWNDSVNFCNWVGITCSLRHPRVTALNLTGRGLRGIISPFVGNLTFLRFFILPNNSLCGEIPQEVGYLRRLQVLDLSNNTLAGVLPVSLMMNCTDLMNIDISRNNLTGKIPMEVGFLVKLIIFQVGVNNLTGAIPPTIGNLSSLEAFHVAYNNLEGHVPEEIERLKRLSVFNIAANNLSGTIPSSLYNMSSIKGLSMSYNLLRGTLPENIGITLPNLQILNLGSNQFSGPIPASLSNASQLQIVTINDNNFVGQITINFGNLRELQWLAFAINNLGSNSSNDLDFIRSLRNCSNLGILDISRNNFGGVLPASLANLSAQLDLLYLQSNQLSGNITGAILENYINLISLRMGDNLFTGTIPSSFGKFQSMQWLYLSGNKFDGQIPSSLGNLSQLSYLFLSNNMLEGSIPPSLGNCQRLQYLEISGNKLSGAIPQQVIGMSSLSLALNLSKNSLNGTLPLEVVPELGRPLPAWNSFQGMIPSALASLKAIQDLDLSRNKLSGPIPIDLYKIPFSYLNLSYNNLEGEVLQIGSFRNASEVLLTGNIKLCGGVPTLKLPACPVTVSKRGKKHKIKLIIIIVCGVMCFLLISFSVVVCWRRKSKEKPSSAVSTVEHLPKVSYRRLYEATGGFSTSNLIGSGGFGSVYKGILDQGQSVAVKVFNLQQIGASKSFIAECNSLGNIRHRNLVKIITCCSSIDYNHNEFKAVVYKFMTNGSLEKWLHPCTESEDQTGNLSFIQRLNIAIDEAAALHYLHDQCETTVLHCDIKPSNVLLDHNMTAHLSDFGLARLLSTSNSQAQSSTVGMKGTIGYAAPEYGMGGQASKEGDVYSYGILVLEMFTGRRPTDEIFESGLNFHSFVENALPEKLLQIVNPTVVPREVTETETAAGEDRYSYEDEKDQIEAEEEGEASYKLVMRKMDGNMQSCLHSVLNIALACSVESPWDRMNMADVTRELHRIKKCFP
ncbi:hypothetical protein FNV43_RR22043 [Rhamnella rubrinervis]|uniref:Protein kinase domain-containing protein n=1 Tax=Rhamnella rubrinervis TaxID=2594499 RepID=A0A8K0DUE2_9ROSA|nr:hypothetical protein FNV43_RR22043 [Rhamnella rubrinervis]